MRFLMARLVPAIPVFLNQNPSERGVFVRTSHPPSESEQLYARLNLAHGSSVPPILQPEIRLWLHPTGKRSSSPRLTTLRAEHHINDLNARINEFVSNKPWSDRIESDPNNPGHQVHKIAFARRLPSDLSCIVFDAASNLRAVLDQVGYASAVASGRENPKRTNFPFADDLAGLNNNIDGRKVCDHLPSEITALFRSFKPYKGGNNILWALNRLCNTNKHATLAPFDLGQFNLGAITEISKTAQPLPSGGGEIRIEGRLSGFIGRITAANSSWNAEKHEITISGIPEEVGSQYKADVALNVAIDGIEVLARQPAVAVLNAMGCEVQRVGSATEAECRRLGFIK